MSTKMVPQELVKQAGEMLKNEHLKRLELEKQATAHELEKRAAKIAFREVELGIAEPFKNFEEFQQKVANLMQDDLDVVEKALDRGYSSSRRLGDLEGGSSGKGFNPFEHYVQTGELSNE